MSKQTEAQRLAADLSGIFVSEEIHASKAAAIAAELLRQEALIAELAGAMRNISLQCQSSHLPPGLTPSDFGNYDDYSSYISALNFGSVGDIARAALAKVPQ